MEEGGVVPPPRNPRPTVIRSAQGNEKGNTVPARPAPPAPGARPQSVFHGERPPPPKPQSQPAQAKPPSPAPAKPQRPMSVNMTNKQNSTPSGKKRPEITIMSAKPMSEVGFRDLKGDKSPVFDRNHNSDVPKTAVPPIPPINDPPPIPARSSDVILHDNNNIIKPSLPGGRPVIPPRVGGGSESVAAKISPKQELNSMGLHAFSEKSETKKDQNMPSKSDDNSHIQNVKKLSENSFSDHRPVPKPRVLPSKNSPDDDLSCQTMQNNNVQLENSEPVSSSGSVRPKRPTIIRVDKSKSSSQINSNICDNIEPVPSKINNDKSLGDRTESGKTDEDSANNKTNSRLSSAPPPLAPKPKPTIAAKPKPESFRKGKNVDCQIEQKSVDMSEKEEPSNKLPVTKRPNIIRAPPKPKRVMPLSDAGNHNGEGENSEKQELNPSEAGSEKTKEDYSDSRNKITVIEGCEYAQVNKSQKRVKPTPKDDFDIHEKSPSPPPVPKKRPVSICNIPQAMKEEEAKNRIGLSSSFSEKRSNPDLNVPQEGSPKIRQKPIPRGRPVSLAVSTTIQKEGRPQIDRPPPPVGRPPPPRKNSTPTTELSKVTPDNSTIASETRSAKPPPRPISSPHTANKFNEQIEKDLNAKEENTKPSPVKHKSGPPPRPSVPIKQPPPKPEVSPSNLQSASDVEGRPHVHDKQPPPKPEVSPSNTQSHLDLEKARKPTIPQSPKLTSPDVPELPPRPGPTHCLYHYMLTVPHCIAEFDYQGRELDELSFQAGTTIILSGRIDSSWLLGKIGEREGIFPEEFVQIVVPLEGETVDGNEDTEETGDLVSKPDWIGSGPRCRARFDFESDDEGELSFEEGDYIQLLERIGDEWMKGNFNGKTGIFPLSFVEIIEDLPLDQASHSDNVGIALYDFESDVPSDLNIKTGDKIIVLSEVNAEWLYGELNGHQGQFPKSFIDKIPENLPKYSLSDSIDLSKEPADTKELNLSETADSEPENLFRTTEPDPMDYLSGTKEGGPEKILSSPAEKCLGTCTALYDFEASSPGDLGFSEGQTIIVLSYVDSDWLRGKIGDTEGIFPASFVKIDMESG